MGANFTPDWNGYTSMKPFKFWCQKVLPTVYDDSLSYYEVLCKLVKYLNQVIENMEKVEENTDALLVAYNELQNWVNDYFDNLDVQDEIDHKIDEMVEDGTFDRWIEPIIEGYEGDLQALLEQYAGDAQEYVKSAEAWAKGTKNGEPVTSDEPQYQNNSKYWSEQSGDNAEDAEAWAKGTKGGDPVTSDEPQYHDNAKYWAEQAQQSAGGAGGYDEDAEAWAVGTKGGEPVASDEPQYENNSKYWAGQAESAAQSVPDLSTILTEVGKNIFFIRTHQFHTVNTSAVNEFGNSVIRFTCPTIDPLFNSGAVLPAIIPFTTGGIGSAPTDMMYRAAVCTRLGSDGQGNYVYGVRVLDNSGNELAVGTEVTLGFVVVGIQQNATEYTPTP